MEIAEENGVPRTAAEFFLDLTGGYPELFEQLYRTWGKAGKKTPAGGETGTLSAGGRPVATFCRLVYSRRLEYRDAVVDLYHHANGDNAINTIRLHQWNRILLDGDDNLRAECLGSASVRLATTSAASQGTLQGELLRNVPFAEQKSSETIRQSKRCLSGCHRKEYLRAWSLFVLMCVSWPCSTRATGRIAIPTGTN